MRTSVAPLQTDLFAAGQPALGSFAEFQRIWLDDAAWLDLGRGWVRGADTLFVAASEQLPWQSHARIMYERVVAVPRLICKVAASECQTLPILHEIGQRLSEHYQCPLALDLAAYYRNGNDSVAWHADRLDLTRPEHTTAIVSLGGPRRLLFRRKGGGETRPLTLASGDALILGGAIQHRFEHCVPKCGMALPRISLLSFGGGDESPSFRSRTANAEHVRELSEVPPSE